MSTVDDILAKCDHLVRTGLWPREQELPYRRWIRNFPPDQQPAAAQLLGQLIYVNAATTHRALASAYQRLIRSLSSAATNAPALSKERIAASHTSIVVTPIRGERPSVADSAFTYMRVARDDLGLSENQLIGDLHTAVSRATSANSVLVLIDDIIGSGDQLISTIRTDHTASPKAMMDQGLTVACLVAVITSQALRRINEEHPSLLVFAGHILDVESYGIQSLLPIPEHTDIHELLKTVAPRLQVEDYINPVYGFNCFGLTLAFHNSIPDFSLPVFWARDGKDWVPLKDRYHE